MIRKSIFSLIKQIRTRVRNRAFQRRLSSFFIRGGVVFVVLILCFCLLNQPIDTAFTPGMTFSRPYAEELGLDPEEMLDAMLDDLGVRHFRIPAYWSLLQPTSTAWEWDWLDQELNAIAERDGQVVLAIGQKLPRWPECWIPDWARALQQDAREVAAITYTETVVRRYQSHPAIAGYQIENEHGFPFGHCPPIRKAFLTEEIDAVRAIDPETPIATTDSGELSLWTLGRHVDRLGVSVYRVVWSPVGIFHYFFVPPQLYARKGQLLQKLFHHAPVYISEFQMEPWTRRSSLTVTPIPEQMRTFSPKQMEKNLRFAERMDIMEIYFWGGEWWYWMKTKQDDSRFWEIGKTVFSNR